MFFIKGIDMSCLYHIVNEINVNIKNINTLKKDLRIVESQLLSVQSPETEVQVDIGASNTQINRQTSENSSLNRERRLVECSTTSIGNLDKRKQAIQGLQIVKVNTFNVDTSRKIEIKEKKS